MKTYLVLFSFIFALNSCSDTSEESPLEGFSEKTIIQQWKLYKMTGSLQGSETTGDQMAWQESYRFNTDSTFSKTRIRNNKTTIASGTFTIYNDGMEEGILLDYNSYSPIIGSCTGEFKEYLYFDTKKDILFSSWWACDGPGLFYRRD